MARPAVRYVRTADGVEIAYATVGTGRPLLNLPNGPTTSVDASWDYEPEAQWLNGLARGRQLVLWDSRGLGLSGGGPDIELTLEAGLLDLDAIATVIGSESFDLFSYTITAPIALSYAIQNPGRVGRIVFWHGYTSVPEFRELSRLSSHRDVVQQDPSAWRTMMMGAMLGFSPPREAVDHQLALMDAARMDSAPFRSAIANQESWDFGELLPQVSAPALQLVRREAAVPLEMCRKFASAMPDAQYSVLDGDALQPWVGEFGTAHAVIDEFLRGEHAGAAPSAGGFQTILFTDLEASTPVTQRLGDEGAQVLLRGHNETVRTALRDHGGREVKHTGDGIMASFPSAVAAVTAALQIQQELAGGEVRVRVGLNAGEPIAEDDDLFGLSVIKAARVADRADPGQVLVSRVVRELCEGKTFQFASLGAVQLKGFDEAVELFEVTV